MARILAIDYGTKRVGVASTDPLQIVASALATVDAAKLMTFLEDYLRKENVECIVVGKPMRLDGSDTHASKPAEQLVKQLQQKFPHVKIAQVDERFTSAIAQRSLLEMGLKKKDRQNKGNIDQVSAVLILQTYMEMQR